MASSDRIDELKRKFDENPRRYFAPLANEFRKSGDFEQAILICQEFLPQQPGHMSGHIVYGQALFEAGRLDEARGVFETALTLDPENLIALRHLGDIAGRQGDAATARRWYERVLEADPRNDEIHALLGALAEPAAVPSPPPPSATPVPEQGGAEPAHADPVSHVAPSEPIAAHVDTPELLDLDVALPESPSPALPAAAAGDDDREVPGFGTTMLPGIEPTPETAELMPAVDARTDGFEAGEFTAPESRIEPTPGLQTSYEVETGVHPVFFAPMSGLDRPETTAEPATPLETTSAFPELDEPLSEDRGDVVPPHGDPIGESAPAPTAVERDDALLDFDMPLAAEPVRQAAPASESSTSEPPRFEAEPFEVEPLESEPVAEAPAPSIPAELPPEVIAAEAELIEAGVSMADPSRADGHTDEGEHVGQELSFLDVNEPAREDDGDSAAERVEASSEPVGETVGEAISESAPSPAPEPTPAEPRPFVTETMAELYVKQGFRGEALSVYEQLSATHPADERLAARVASLRAEIATPATPSGPPVREFFARFAARRPGERAAAAAPPAFDDFGPGDEPAPENGERSAPTTSGAEDDQSTVANAGAADSTSSAQRVSGSIDALFGHQAVDAPEDSAASALAQAFGTGGETPPIAGNPSRPATGELTLDSVFRDGGSRGPRTSQGFSFDQFFSQNVDGDRTSGGANAPGEAPASGEPAERGEDDIEQFNSWLQGLKQR